MTNPPNAEYFDEWYSNMKSSPRLAQIVQDTLGLPQELDSSSLLPWSGIATVSDALGIAPGELLVDLACGRGGYGMEVARRTGARLIGIDFSAVALEVAASTSAQRPDLDADFRLGELTATGLPDDSVNAMMCIDSIQFAAPYEAAVAEAARVLVPGGALVVTGWMASDPSDESLPARLRVDIGRMLCAGGLQDVTVVPQPSWHAAELVLWETAVALEPGDDPSLVALRDEGTRVLQWAGRRNRVLARGIAR